MIIDQSFLQHFNRMQFILRVLLSAHDISEVNVYCRKERLMTIKFYLVL